MSKSPPVLSLSDRQNELTRRLILDAAIEILEAAPVSELTVRVVAKRAAISERTIFRYFPTRDEFLDAIADSVSARLDLPPAPRSLEELLAYPRLLYRRIEAKDRLNKAALHSELFHRMRDNQGKARWVALRKLVDQIAPDRSERARKIAATNIRYNLTGSTWYYYRFNFGLNLEDSIACAEIAVRDAIKGLGVQIEGSE